MNPLQTRMATLGLQALADHGFVLAGGYALQVHGFGNRESDDIDLFTNDLDPDTFAEAIEHLVTAYRSAGLQVEVVRQVPTFARLVVTDDDTAAKADLAVDHRLLPPTITSLGPVLSEADAIGSKVGAVYSRLEPRDLIDVQAVLDSDRYSTDALLALADQREVTPLDRTMLAGQLRASSRLPDAGFQWYGASAELIARIRRTAEQWAERLDRPSEKMGE
ncbi:nucleotidyl transferase AbiEii/AbiGii toxin family protein [Kribbella sp. NBC_00709]|uniref:nucleotidyl transferase AbiEii/AbiGii toxin family protein n=1 Tax=Kribbella sp. NBC_00709 TaxID=2975972 RepID=UPI002E2BDD97|nr:nucleotidyl transferase AbiEii/AbiGii toxin family protein [Kribbella sp. NBC_00709]